MRATHRSRAQRRGVGLLLGLIILTSSVAAGAAPQAHASTTPAGRTLFDDEFSTPALAAAWYPNRWFANTCAPGATTGEGQYYTRAGVSIGGGTLRLTARKGTYHCPEGSWAGNRPYSSGWIQTGGARTSTITKQPGFTFRYGHVSVRFKEPAGRGLWPAIWLAAAGTHQTYPWPPEIDLLESYGNPSIWSFHVHLAGNINTGKDFHGPNTATGYHTVSLNWQPTAITWSIDGHITYRYTGKNIPNIPMYLIVNLATGGLAGIPLAGGTMQVDWVHVTT